jgi:hypothetical protein
MPFLAALSILLSAQCLAAPPCAESIRDLRTLLADPEFPLKWRETSMSDGKPLLLTIFEREGALIVSFEKTEEGLWAEGVSVVCRNGTDYEIRFVNDSVRFGHAASLMLQYSVLNGPPMKFTKTGAEKMQVGLTGWSGEFCSSPSIAR